MDNLTKEQRKKNMQHIRSRDTEPERKVMTELRRRKIYFAKYAGTIIGKPDIVFRRKKVAVFIDSDFWHGHPKRGVLPKSNRKYWLEKLRQNQARDQLVNRELKRQGWKVIRIWEHDVEHRFEKCLRKILIAIE